MDSIYVDHAATTPLDDRVLDYMIANKDLCFANPSSVHSAGREASKYLRQSREHIAEMLGAEANEIIFTSGGTEANNLAIIGLARAYESQGKHIITTKQEHQSVLQVMSQLEEDGFDVTYLPVTENGLVRLTDLHQALTEETILFSTAYVNNETGVKQDVQAIGALLKEYHVLYHLDAVQALRTETIHVKDLNVDALSLSAHKINGPNGVGLLYLQDDIRIEPLLLGGTQEKLRRAGTENLFGVLGFEKAIEIAREERVDTNERFETYRTLFLQKLDQANVQYQVNGDLNTLSPHIVNLSFTNIPVEIMLMNLDLEKINASAGSACTAGTLERSHVLRAMYGNEARVAEAIRFSFGSLNNRTNVEQLAAKIIKITKRFQTNKDRR